MFAIKYLAPINVLWFSALGVSSIYTWEPMFHISICFEFVSLGFESLKVGQLSMSCWYKMFKVVGSPVWCTITFDQSTKMLKFILCCIIDIKDMLCFNFEPMKNPFDQFSNMILNAISIILLVSAFADLLEPLFVML